MAKMTIELSKQSLERAIKNLQDFADDYKKGISNSIKAATERLYQLIIAYCNSENVGNYTDAIQWEYDEKKNVGRVWVTSEGKESHGLVIILNEFGTGIKGTQDEYANKHGYKVNASGKGQEGWWYPTTESDPNPYKWVDKDGQLRALTHGLPSKHMFYNAFQDVKREFGDIINIELQGTIGKLYD